MKTEDIYFVNNLFDDINKKDLKISCGNVIQDMSIDQNESLFEDLPEELPSKKTKINFNHYRLKRNECLEMAAKRIKKNIKSKDKQKLKNQIKKIKNNFKKQVTKKHDLETIDYNNDINLHDVQIVDYNITTRHI